MNLYAFWNDVHCIISKWRIWCSFRKVGGGERKFQMTGIFFIFGMRFILSFRKEHPFYHSANDGHSFPLKQASRKPSRRLHRPFPYHTAAIAKADPSRTWKTVRFCFVHRFSFSRQHSLRKYHLAVLVITDLSRGWITERFCKLLAFFSAVYGFAD